MKVDDPQLSWVRLVIHCVLCVNLLFCKFVGCGGPFCIVLLIFVDSPTGLESLIAGVSNNKEH